MQLLVPDVWTSLLVTRGYVRAVNDTRYRCVLPCSPPPASITVGYYTDSRRRRQKDPLFRVTRLFFVRVYLGHGDANVTEI